jgi:tyrosyl-tRNA synthetase
MNMIAMHLQLKKLWSNVDSLASRFGYRKEWAWKRALYNNNAWLNKLNITELLRDLGPGLRLGNMLGKDT